jgi:hypothetical protein
MPTIRFTADVTVFDDGETTREEMNHAAIQWSQALATLAQTTMTHTTPSTESKYITFTLSDVPEHLVDSVIEMCGYTMHVSQTEVI